MKPRHLPNAPIVEAVLDLRVELPPNTTVESLDAFHNRVRDRYPTRQPRTEFRAQLDPAAGTVSADEPRQLGFLYWTEDKRTGVQARVDGFSLSRLKPYENWKELRDEADRLWRTYVEVAQPIRIVRVAVRYINRLELPNPAELEQYLTTFPKLGKECPQAISGLLMRVVVAHEHGTVVISEAIDVQHVTDATLPIILDIDAFRQVSLALDREAEAWSALEELRTLKNEVFFGSITEDAGKLFG